MSTNKTISGIALAAAVMGIGLLSACGSSTTAESASTPAIPNPAQVVPTASSSEIAERESGIFTRDLKFNTVNDSDKDIKIVLQQTRVSGKQPLPSHILKPGESVPFKWVIFSIENPTGGKADYFIVNNPLVGKPNFSYDTRYFTQGGIGAGDASLSPGESQRWTSPKSGRTYVMSRGDDSSKEFVPMTLTVVNN